MLIVFQFKYGLIYREIARTPVFEICQLMEMGASNLLVGMMLQMFKDSAPEAIHKCPYNVKTKFKNEKKNILKVFVIYFLLQGVEIRNRSVSTKSFPDIFPSGDYKVFFHTSTKNETIADVMLVYSIISSNRDTFG